MKKPVKVKVGDMVTQADWGGSPHKVTKVGENVVWIEHQGEEYRYGTEAKWIVVKKAPPAKKRPHGPQEYKGNGKHSWEAVTGSTVRLRVPGGWLYGKKQYEDKVLAQTTFVPVPEAVGYAV